MGMTVNPLSPVLGAEVTGLDLSRPLGENLLSEVRQSWLEAGGLLVIPGQRWRWSRISAAVSAAPVVKVITATVMRVLISWG